jgi:hypothetical protein
MATISKVEKEDVIFVELSPAPGVRQINLRTGDIVEKSAEAISHAMRMVRGLAKRR